MARFVTAVRVAGSMTNTAFVREQDTQARRGLPANTTSPGPAGVSKVALTVRAATSTMLIVDEMWFSTHSSFAEANRAVTGSRPTATLPIGVGTPVDTSNSSTRASGRLHTAKVRPSGPSARGWTGAVSKFTKLVKAPLAPVTVTDSRSRDKQFFINGSPINGAAWPGISNPGSNLPTRPDGRLERRVSHRGHCRIITSGSEDRPLLCQRALVSDVAVIRCVG